MKIQMYGSPNDAQNEIGDNLVQPAENYYYDDEYQLPEYLTDDYEPDLWLDFLERYHGEGHPVVEDKEAPWGQPPSYLHHDAEGYYPYAGYTPYSEHHAVYTHEGSYPHAFGTDVDYEHSGLDDHYYRTAAVQERLSHSLGLGPHPGLHQ